METIELANIDQELTRRWDEIQGTNKIRASLFNLIIYAKKNDRVDYYHSLVKSVVSKFPCRVLLIVSDDTPGKEYLKSSVASEIVTNSNMRIFCELIRIDVSSSLEERVYFLLLPHLLCDLPIYLLWTADPAKKNKLLPRLESLVNRIIFDSEETENLNEYAEITLSLLKKIHCQIGDLNWSALSGWRSIISTFFDSKENHDLLISSNKIVISYVKNPNMIHQHQEIEAAYLQSWLSSILDWKFQKIDFSNKEPKIYYKTFSGECIICLHPQKNVTLAAGTLLSIEIEGGEEGMHLSFKRYEQTRQIFIQYSDKNRCDLPHYNYLPGVEEGKEIIQEIFYPSKDDHYAKMLTMLSQIQWQRV